MELEDEAQVLVAEGSPVFLPQLAHIGAEQADSPTGGPIE